MKQPVKCPKKVKCGYTAIYLKGGLICIVKKAQMQKLKINKVKNWQRFLVEDALSVDFNFKPKGEEG
jgi:hypothetical protein